MTTHVKIQGIIPRIQYTADGALTTYEFPFAIFSTEDIEVYLNNTKQDSAAYSVTGVRDSEGGSITFAVAPTSGTTVTIVRNLSIERTSDFQEGGALRADTLNDEFDYQIACQQQLAENLNRSMVLPPYAVANDVDLTLPTPSAGKAIVWNADGTNLENSTVSVNALESTLKSYKESAESAASAATTKAGIASDKADLATTKADLATTQAGIATTQAGIATAKAEEATTTVASKANKDMDNLSTTGKEAVVGLCVPDFTRGISRTAGSSSSPHEAASDCLVVFSGQSTSSSGSGATLKVYIDSEWVKISGAEGNGLSTLNSRGNCYLPKGTQYCIATASFQYCYEFPLKGV